MAGGFKISFKIDIQNSKLIVANDYQQFLAHFEWFLSLFQTDVKKYPKMVFFG